MPGVDHHRRRPPRREGRQHSVPGQEERRGTAPLENALDDLLAVAVGLRGGLGEHEGVLAGVEAEAVLEGVVPEGLDGVPVGVGAVGAEGGDDLFFFFFFFFFFLREEESGGVESKKKGKKYGFFFFF